MLSLVRYARACWTFSKITKCQYLWEGLSYFVYFLYGVTHQWTWKLQCYHSILFGYGPEWPKLSEIQNCHYLWKGFSDFVDFLHVVICILLDTHWSYKNMLFCVGNVRHRLSATQIVRCCKLKKLKNYMRYQVDFLLPLKLQKVSCYFGYGPKNLLANQFAEFFTFDLFDLLILIQGVHCYIALVYIRIYRPALKNSWYLFHKVEKVKSWHCKSKYHFQK